MTFTDTTSGQPGASGFEYDFFISRRGPVAETATFVADVLKGSGYRVLVQDYDIPVGSDFIHKMHQGLTLARDLIVLLTDDYDQQPFTWWEFSGFASAAPPMVSQRRMVLLRLTPCQPRGLLSSIVFQDLVGVDDPIERRQRILDAAAGVSKPAPFQLVSTRLKDNLRPFSEISDAWLRLTEGQLSSEVPFIGREAELARLVAFATGEDDPRPFTWQVLWGAHATGKSRLAREWLRMLSMSSLAWDGGFVGYSGAELLNLLSLQPSAPTAIVIDDAASYGDNLWKFLLGAERWRKASTPVRVLLVAHEELVPPASLGFDRAEAIRTLRQVAPLDKARIASLFQAGMAKSTLGPVPGLRLDPLREGVEQAAILDAVANMTRPLSPDESKKILEEADGRPALLILAAANPKGWRGQLANYAPAIVKDAEGLFTPSQDGLKVLAASVLIGPFSDLVRRTIAPGANTPDRMLRLFPDPLSDLASEIPRFQPDILGYHVLGSALSGLSSSERLDLARHLQKANRERYVAQIDSCFKALDLSKAYLYRLLAPNESREDARLAAALDDIVLVMAEHTEHTRDTPSSKASLGRRDTIITSLRFLEHFSEPELAKVVQAALLYLPKDGFGDLLVSALQEHGIRRAEISRWLALIEVMTSPFGANARAHLSVDSFRKRNPLTDDGAAALATAMQSANSFDRLEAAYELGVWLQENPIDGRSVLETRQQLFAALSSMIESRNDPHVTAAAWCLKQARLWLEPLRPSAEIDRILTIAYASLRRWMVNPEPRYFVQQLIGLFGLKVDCRIAEYEQRWFDQILDIQLVTENNLGSDAIALFRGVANGDYETVRIGSQFVESNEEAAASILMRSGLYEPGIATAAERLLLDGAVTEQRLSTLCRVAATRTAEARAFLATVVGKMNDADEVAIFVCAFALLSREFEVIEVMRPIVERSWQPLDVDTLLDVARKRPFGGPWQGKEVRALLKRLADFRVRRSGHLIHKLKAKDSTGRWAYYFVMVRPEKEAAFMSAIGGDGMIDLEDYGDVIASCYGESPNDETLAFLKDKYGFNIKK